MRELISVWANTRQLVLIAVIAALYAAILLARGILQGASRETEVVGVVGVLLAGILVGSALI